MCIGIPMQVITANASTARCRPRDGDDEHMVDTRLVGTPEPGAWLMVSLGAAREVIAEETAHRCADALLALDMAMRGETDFDHLYADLVNCTPELPAFLRTSAADHAEQASAPPVRTAKEVLIRVEGMLRSYAEDGPHNIIDLAELDAAGRKQIDEVFGEGEVTVSGDGCFAREAVLPGIWRVYLAETGEGERDLIEPGRFPTSVAALIFRKARTALEIPANFEPGVMNAQLLLAEINDRLAHMGNSGEPHVINLSRLPHTDMDLKVLDDQLGASGFTIQSHGFGLCTASATATRNVWRVRFHDAQGILILDTIEMTPIPEVVRATSEDITLSAERLADIIRTST